MSSPRTKTQTQITSSQLKSRTMKMPAIRLPSMPSSAKITTSTCCPVILKLLWRAHLPSPSITLGSSCSMFSSAKSSESRDWVMLRTSMTSRILSPRASPWFLSRIKPTPSDCLRVIVPPPMWLSNLPFPQCAGCQSTWSQMRAPATWNFLKEISNTLRSSSTSQCNSKACRTLSLLSQQ